MWVDHDRGNFFSPGPALMNSRMVCRGRASLAVTILAPSPELFVKLVPTTIRAPRGRALDRFLRGASVEAFVAGQCCGQADKSQVEGGTASVAWRQPSVAGKPGEGALAVIALFTISAVYHRLGLREILEILEEFDLTRCAHSVPLSIQDRVARQIIHV